MNGYGSQVGKNEEFVNSGYKIETYLVYISRLWYF